MKKVLKKLALHRETLASLQPDVLEGIAGGNQQSAITPVTRTLTTTTHPPRTISICPSVLNCPSIPSLPSLGGGKGAQ